MRNEDSDYASAKVADRVIARQEMEVITMNKPILIASARVDEPTYGLVRDILEKSGHSVVIYQTEQVLSGQARFTIALARDGHVAIDLNGISIRPDHIAAAWYRKIGSFAPLDTNMELAKQLYINNEVRVLHDTIWSLFPDEVWLSSPRKLAKAERKLDQLLIAREVGFSVPETIVSSDWDAICGQLLAGDDSRIIIKMMRGVISDGDTVKAMFTHIADRGEANRLKEYTTSFPGIYQPYVEKSREWRVTVVGDSVFPVSIYTDERAKDDWRRLQETESVQFRREELPEGVGERCVQYLAKLGLRFGAFDLIETPDGEIVFLECNPNGQYGWLEDEPINYPISGAVAAELIKIAEGRV